MRFFGKITASVTHDIKNVLAIINENAGLLADLVGMSKTGRPLDPARFETVSQKIQFQVGRADEIIQNLNRFSHSVDESPMTVDVGVAITLMISLCARLTAVRRRKLNLINPEQSFTIVTDPFALENILWRCFDFAMNATEQGEQAIRVSQDPGPEDGVCVHFCNLSGLTPEFTAAFPGKEDREVLAALAGRIAFNLDAREMILSLPRQI